MSIWIWTACQKSVRGVSMRGLILGIEERLQVLCFRYGEFKPEKIVDKLRLSNLSETEEFKDWALCYKGDLEGFIRVELWHEDDLVKDEIQELLCYVDKVKEKYFKELNRILQNTTEIVGFELKTSDMQGIGWPVALAAAAFLAEVGKGTIYAEGEGWILPTDGEIKNLT